MVLVIKMKIKEQIVKRYRIRVRSILSGKLILEELEEAKHKAEELSWVLELSRKEINTIYNQERKKGGW